MPSKARLSKRLVTLDDKVKLDVPLADLAVHEPDYKHLIAFLKAMEFTTLTRRVAEFSGRSTPAQIEADGQLKVGRASAASAAPRLVRQRRPGPGEPWPGRTARAHRARRPRTDRARRELARRQTEPEYTPQALAAARIEAARNAKVDRSRYEIVRSLDRLKAWIARAHRARPRRDRHRDHQPRPDAGDAVRHLARARAERSLLRAARASARRRRRQRRTVRAATSRPTRFPSATRSQR